MLGSWYDRLHCLYPPITVKIHSEVFYTYSQYIRHLSIAACKIMSSVFAASSPSRQSEKLSQRKFEDSVTRKTR